MPSIINHITEHLQKEEATKTNKASFPLTIEEKTVMHKALNNPIESLRELSKNSLYSFIKIFWDTYTEDTFIPNWHIEKICEELEIVARRVANKETKLYDLIINVPPGSTKTAMVSIFFPVWCWVNWYWMRFITTSHTESLSLESAEYSRDIIRSDKFRLLFPEIDVKADKDKKSNFRVIFYRNGSLTGHVRRFKVGGGRISTSVGAKITGFHAHIIIPDDLIDPKSVLSEVKLEEANKYLGETLSTRKTDKDVSAMIMIMQRLHENDPTGFSLKKEHKRIRHISLPGQIVDYEPQLQPKEWKKYYKDGLFDPRRMSWAVLEELEADLGQYGFSGQIGQKPTPPGGGMFKVDRFRYVHSMPPTVSILRTVRYWDKAGTDEKELIKGKDAAYTAGVKIHYLVSGKWIVSDVVRGRWSSEEREAIIRSTAEADGDEVIVWVEQEPGSGGKESAQGTIRNLAGFVVKAEHPTGNKVFRADPYSVQVNNGNILLLTAQWNKAFVDEHETFPFGKYKDQVDAVAAGFNKLTARRMAGPVL